MSVSSSSLRGLARFRAQFAHRRANLIGMVHAHALPGTPLNDRPLDRIVEVAAREAELYARVGGVDGIVVENMRDLPYVQPGHDLGPEITASMTAVCAAVRRVFPARLPVGVQVLAGGNREALAVAQAAGLQFLRAEGFVFASVADEGLTQACAGPLMRYRRHLGADADVAVWCDVKKKHSAHAITADVDAAETARAAQFFLADGVVVTGAATGRPADAQELEQVLSGVPDLPVIVGSGVTPDNAKDFAGAHGLIVGSYFKKDGHWDNELDAARIERLAEAVAKVRPRE